MKFQYKKLYMEYYDENSKKNQFFRIFATEENLKLLSSKNISQYFIDSTYRCIPNSQNNYEAFVLLIGYNTIREMFELCCCAIFSKEDTIIYKKFYETLKYNYSFEPKKITMDFALANLNAVREVYGRSNLEILPCLFHLLQAWWRKAIKLGLKKKEYIKNTQTILFNLEILPFFGYSKAIQFYKKLKENIMIIQNMMNFLNILKKIAFLC